MSRPDRALPLLAALALVAALAAAGPAAAYPGAPWFEPSKPYTENFPDPSVSFDPASGRYHAYATTTGGAYLPAMSSTDGLTWIARPAYPQPACVPGPADPFFNDALPCPAAWAPDLGPGRLAKQLWAPGVARIGGRHVAWYAVRTSAVTPRFCLAAAVASDPLGPFTDVHDGPYHCDLDPNGSIDPQPFVDPATGTPYLIWKSEGVPGSQPTRFWVRELTADGTGFAPRSRPHAVLATSQRWEGNVIESPTMVRWAGRWLLFYSANEWTTADYAIGVAFCDSPTGPCRKSPHNPVLRSEGWVLGPGGPSAFVDATGALRLAHHHWTFPFVGYPTDPNCDGPGLCASQGQRRMRVVWVTVAGDDVQVRTTPPVTVAARDIAPACPAGLPSAGYADVPAGSTHARAIDCVAAWGVARGTSATTYGPDAPVTREQMASFVARLVDRTDRPLPVGAADAFADDGTSGHEAAIDRLAAAGIVSGVGEGRYAPRATVSRAAMATFLARAAAWVRGEPLAAGQDAFADDTGSVHAANVDRVAAAGIATGTAPGAFSPADDVSRAQMAGFLARLAALLVEEGHAVPPPS